MLIEYKNTDRKFDVENIRKSKMKNEIKLVNYFNNYSLLSCRNINVFSMHINV